MDDINLATREIFWNIPYSYKVTMYVLFVASLLIFIRGFYEQTLFITHAKGIKALKDLIPKKLCWKSFFATIFLTGKVRRKGTVAFFHSLIYYGFVILWIATDLVAIHADTPFKIYKGMTYIVISFLSDIAGITILIGIALAYKRRYIDRPKYLSSTKPNRELWMYAILVALVLIGYALEALRIFGTHMPVGEAYWSPIGYFLAKTVYFLPFSYETMGRTYQFLWMIHMINTMIFVAMIPYSKFSHIILLPLSALITPSRQGAVLSPMNFEDESLETFGLGKLSEMTVKNRFDLLSCVECGRCSQVCPALTAGKNLDPKTIITKARDLGQSHLSSENSNVDFWEHKLYASNEIDACTTCGACMEECPANIEHVNIIMDLKRYKALTLGDIPRTAADTVNKIKVNGNPWGLSQDDRFQWADGLDIPIIKTDKKVDYLYYVGCAGSYDRSNQKVVRDTLSLLKMANVSFAVLGKTEKCNGDPIRRFGDEYSFHEVAIENIAHMNQYTFDKVVTHCPHCLHTIGKEYAGFKEGQFTTIHHTELLANLIKEDKIQIKKKLDEKLTFHDPCYLGRHHGEYDAPRDILKAIPGLHLQEMEESKDKAVCCGMGGGNMWYELPEGEYLSEKRLQGVAKTRTQKLATSCSYCMINFNSSKSKIKEVEEIEIQDVASILAEATS